MMAGARRTVVPDEAAQAGRQQTRLSLWGLGKDFSLYPVNSDKHREVFKIALPAKWGYLHPYFSSHLIIKLLENWGNLTHFASGVIPNRVPHYGRETIILSEWVGCRVLWCFMSAFHLWPIQDTDLKQQKKLPTLHVAYIFERESKARV